MRPWPTLALLLFGLTLPGGTARTQNAIAQDGWQGFAMRSADGAFDRCVLYNRTVEALGASPYDMLGITRDGAGTLGLMVFFEPGQLQRGRGRQVSLKLDQGPAESLAGDIPSDFHVVIAGPLPVPTVAALRRASSLEATVDGKTVRIAVAGVGAVLDRLERCVETYAH